MVPNLAEDIVLSGSTIYVKGDESIRPGIYYKTVKAIQYINKNYDYDILLRTNLSSFYNLDHLIKSHANLANSPIFYGGIYQFGRFVSGTGIFISKKATEYLTLNDNYEIEHDDVLISRILSSSGSKLIKFDDNLMVYCCNDNSNLPSEGEIKNALYFRIKNQNRQYDIELFHKLKAKLYPKL